MCPDAQLRPHGRGLNEGQGQAHNFDGAVSCIIDKLDREFFNTSLPLYVPLFHAIHFMLINYGKTVNLTWPELSILHGTNTNAA